MKHAPAGRKRGLLRFRNKTAKLLHISNFVAHDATAQGLCCSECKRDARNFRRPSFCLLLRRAGDVTDGEMRGYDPSHVAIPASSALTVDRRGLVTAGLGIVVAGCAGIKPLPQFDGRARLGEIERAAGGRLGAWVLDTGTGKGFGWREGERFAHCSSFKLSLAALVLSLADEGALALGEPVPYSRGDLLSNSPVTAAHVDEGRLPIGELAHAAVVTSDNAAANILMRRLGGPEAVTGFWRSLGDMTSRLDRIEPALNVVPPGTALDTTTPSAMASTVAKLTVGTALSEASRRLLIQWMIEVQTGKNRIRAGLPPAWLAGDKTGTATGATQQTYVDLAYAVPPGRRPIVIAAYFEPATPVEGVSPALERVLADVARAAAEWIAGAPENRSAAFG